MKRGIVERTIFQLLLARDGVNSLRQLCKSLEQEDDILLMHAETPMALESCLASQTIDLVIVDSSFAGESGLETVKHLARKYPVIQTVLVSEQDPSHFHQLTEGLGVLMQLPEEPEYSDCQELIHLLFCRMQELAEVVNLDGRKQ